MAGGEHSVVLYRPGPRWDHAVPLGEQEVVSDHFAYLVGLIGEGLVETAGPFHRAEERVGERFVGLVVFTVAVGEARRLTASDPAVVAGLMEYDVLPWYP
jgi:hypothetical protein